MTALSKSAILGCAKETTPYTYQAPTFYVPFTKADYEDTTAEIKDESYRANDTSLQGLYAGVQDAMWQIDVMSYPDICGHFLRGIIGPDTVTAGVSTTLSSASVAGATTLPVAASIPAQSYIMVDTNTNLEYALVTAVTGTGPYTLTVQGIGTGGGLQYAHASGATVVAQTTHTFKQPTGNPIAQPPTYSFTVFDTLEATAYVGAKMSDLQLKIDPKSAVSFSLKYASFPYTTQGVSGMTPQYTGYPPAIGWQWVMQNAGATSNRGLTLDLTLKRAVESIHSSDGIQAPREIFAGTLDADATYKAIFDSLTDLNLYLNYTQTAATATLQQPVSAGGASLALTMSKSGWYKGKRDLSTPYVQADFSYSGIYNATDGGAVSAVLKNFQTTAY